MTMKDIARWKRILSRFEGKLVKMNKDVNGRFNDYEFRLMIRQVLLHWCYELVESDFR